MPISEDRLNTWSQVGAGPGSRDTYAAIRRALTHEKAPFANRSIDVFLQGSYGNDTNVWSESDVDVVICTEAVYHSNTDALNQADKATFDRQFVPATYLYDDFKSEVTTWLTGWFGKDAMPGNKAVEIAANSSRRKADVLIANEFRLYLPSNGFMPSRYISGVRFVTRDSQTIVNYPKQHSANLTTRHQESKSWLKPTIRIMKNMRNRMADDKVIERKLAPSYFIEGMMHNVPLPAFQRSFQHAVSASLEWLWTAKFNTLTCANGIHPLVANGTHTSWPEDNYSAFLKAAREYYAKG